MRPAMSRRYRINEPRIVSQTIEGEAVIINLETGNYYSLDDLGAAIWGLVVEARSLDSTVAEVARLYEGTAAEIERAAPMNSSREA
jgi:hypothetical protein